LIDEASSLAVGLSSLLLLCFFLYFILNVAEMRLTHFLQQVLKVLTGKEDALQIVYKGAYKKAKQQKEEEEVGPSSDLPSRDLSPSGSASDQQAVSMDSPLAIPASSLTASSSSSDLVVDFARIDSAERSVARPLASAVESTPAPLLLPAPADSVALSIRASTTDVVLSRTDSAEDPVVRSRLILPLPSPAANSLAIVRRQPRDLASITSLVPHQAGQALIGALVASPACRKRRMEAIEAPEQEEEAERPALTIAPLPSKLFSVPAFHLTDAPLQSGVRPSTSGLLLNSLPIS
jgi:hypothetical protein